MRGEHEERTSEQCTGCTDKPGMAHDRIGGMSLPQNVVPLPWCAEMHAGSWPHPDPPPWLLLRHRGSLGRTSPRNCHWCDALAHVVSGGSDGVTVHPEALEDEKGGRRTSSAEMSELDR
jgi:hypothetical protein